MIETYKVEEGYVHPSGEIIWYGGGATFYTPEDATEQARENRKANPRNKYRVVKKTIEILDV